MVAVPEPLPSLSARLADVRSSPVRDILELTERAEVISFAGGLPAPELFPAEMVAQAFASRARADGRGARPAVLLDARRPGAARAAGRSGSPAGACEPTPARSSSRPAPSRRSA